MAYWEMYSGHDLHYSDVIDGVMASQITSLPIVYILFIRTQIKENIKAPPHWPVNSLHKWPVTRKPFPFDDAIVDNMHHLTTTTFTL